MPLYLILLNLRRKTAVPKPFNSSLMGPEAAPITLHYCCY